jgi:hypothetical protein
MRVLGVLNSDPKTLGSYTSLKKKPVNMNHTIGSVLDVYTDKDGVVMTLDLKDYYEFPLKLKIGTKNYIIR